MIGRLRGCVVGRQWPLVVLEVGGVGYELRVPLSTFEALPPARDEVTLEVLTLLRSESLQLYGFATVQEKRLFETLLGVSGIGPRIALAALSGISSAALVEAVRRDDASLLESVPGIGRKTARRIVLELRDRLDELSEVAPPPVAIPEVEGVSGDDAVAALENLGYRRAEAERAVNATAREDRPADLAALIRGSLGRLRGGA